MATAFTVRGAIRKASHVAWWTVTGQLPRRLRMRRASLGVAGETVVRVDSARRWIDHESPAAPMATLPIPAEAPRLSLVLGDGAGPASLRHPDLIVVLAVRLARELTASLRIIARNVPVDLRTVRSTVTAAGVLWPEHVESCVVRAGVGDQLTLAPNDVFLTTSGAVAEAVVGAVDARRIVVFMAESDETSWPSAAPQGPLAGTGNAGSPKVILESERMYGNLIAMEGAVSPASAVWCVSCPPDASAHEDHDWQNELAPVVATAAKWLREVPGVS